MVIDHSLSVAHVALYSYYESMIQRNERSEGPYPSSLLCSQNLTSAAVKLHPYEEVPSRIIVHGFEHSRPLGQDLFQTVAVDLQRSSHG